MSSMPCTSTKYGKIFVQSHFHEEKLRRVSSYCCTQWLMRASWIASQATRRNPLCKVGALVKLKHSFFPVFFFGGVVLLTMSLINSSIAGRSLSVLSTCMSLITVRKQINQHDSYSFSFFLLFFLFLP